VEPELKTQIDGIQKSVEQSNAGVAEIKAAQERAEKQAKDAAEVARLAADQAKSLEAQLAAEKAEREKAAAELAELKEFRLKLDRPDVMAMIAGGVAREEKSLGEQFHALLKEAKQLDRLVAGQLKKSDVALQVGSFFRQQKATLLTTATDRFAMPQRVPMVTPQLRTLRMRDLFPVLPATSSAVEYVEETGFGGVSTQSITSIASSGTVATATKTAHGYNVGDKVEISGVVEDGYNGVHTVLTVPSSSTFTFYVDSSVSDTTEGTIVARLVSSHGGAAGVSEGSNKPEASFAWADRTAAIVTIAHWIAATRQVLADVPQLRNYVDNRLLYGLKRSEEYQMLYGSGTSGEMLGILSHAGIWNYAQGDPETETPLDALRAAVTLCQLSEYEPNGVVLHPQDWEAIQLQKGADKHYVFGPASIASRTPREVWSLDVVVTNAIAEGTALVGAFEQGAALFEREDAQILIDDRSHANLIANKVTILAEERLGLAIYRPEAFAEVTFS
jgi:hypothetical protein